MLGRENMWIDSHCHLEPDDFRSADGSDEREAVIERARQAGVTRLILVGSGHGRAELENAVALAHSHANIYAAVGIHPHDAHAIVGGEPPQPVATREPGGKSGADPTGGDDPATLQALIERLAGDERVVAVGETGLDYFYKHSTPAAQAEAMRLFLRLSATVRKPVSLHIRDAHDDARRIVVETAAEVYGPGQPHAPGGVIHCFTGGPDDARRWLDLGFHISLSGIVTFKNAAAIREAARLVPADRLLLETDSPYLAPVPRRGTRNEPALLVHTARVVAELRGVSVEKLADETRTATERLFALPPPA